MENRSMTQWSSFSLQRQKFFCSNSTQPIPRSSLFVLRSVQSAVLSLIMHETIVGYKTVNARCKWKRCKMVDGNLFLIFATFELRLLSLLSLPSFLNRYKKFSPFLYSYKKKCKIFEYSFKKNLFVAQKRYSIYLQISILFLKDKGIMDTIFSSLLDRFLFAYR